MFQLCILFFFLLTSFAEENNQQNQQNLCGKKCSYVFIEEHQLKISVNGKIDKTEWINATQITKIILEGQISFNYFESFSSFINLQEIVVNTNTIPKGMFAHLETLQNVTIGKTVESIENRAFESCISLENVIFEDNSQVKRIGNYAFKNCRKLSSITLPKSVSEIDFHYAFQSCPLLKHIGVESGGKYERNEQVIYSDRKTIEFYHKQNQNEMTEKQKEIQITSDIEFIQNRSFSGSQLESIVFSSHLKEIKSRSYYANSHLKIIVIPSQVSLIGELAFAGCVSLEKVIITSPKITIENKAFIGCPKLKNVMIINSSGKDMIVNDDVFESCNQLEKIKVGSEWQGKEMIGGKPISINLLFYGNCGEKCQYIIDKEKEEMNVYGEGSMWNYKENEKEIGWKDYRQYIKGIIIGYGITSIGDNAFYQHESVESIELSSTLTTIGNNSFNKAINLKTIYQWGGLSSIGKNTFSSTGFTSLIIPSQITKMSENSFSSSTNLQTVEYLGMTNPCEENCNSFTENKITTATVSIKYQSTSFCGLFPITSGSCGDNCNWVYYHNNNTLVISGNKMNDYEKENDIPWNYLMKQIKTVKIEIQENIGMNSFIGASLLSSVIIINTQKINTNAFKNCISLQSITLPESVNSIAENSFVNSGLQTIIYEGTNEPKTCGRTSFPTTITQIEVPIQYQKEIICELIPITKGNCGVNNDKTACSFIYNHDDKSMKIIGNGNMIDWENETTVPWNPKSSNITTLTIGTVKNVGTYAFYGAIQITEITLGTTITTIGNYAFSGCSKLTTITLSEGLKTIGQQAFYNHGGLQSITIPTTVTSISTQAFATTKMVSHYWK